MSRIYDVFSIIMFSAAVNIITSLSSTQNKSCSFYIFLIISFGSLSYSGWCYYSLYYKVESYLEKNAGIELTAIESIKRSGESSTIKRYYIVGAICFILGMLFFLASARL